MDNMRKSMIICAMAAVLALCLACAPATRGDGITVWALDGEGGAQRVAFVNTGVHPRNFAITPDGRWLLCACRDSDCIMVYGIDPQTGVPGRSGQDIQMPAPVCISFLADNK